MRQVVGNRRPYRGRIFACARRSVRSGAGAPQGATRTDGTKCDVPTECDCPMGRKGSRPVSGREGYGCRFPGPYLLTSRSTALYGGFADRPPGHPKPGAVLSSMTTRDRCIFFLSRPVRPPASYLLCLPRFSRQCRDHPHRESMLPPGDRAAGMPICVIHA